MKVEAADGPLALGCQGSACDRLRLTGGLRAPALGSYIVSLRWRGTAPSAPFLGGRKTVQPPWRARKCIPLWCRKAPKGERSEPVSRMLITPYDTESKSRNVLASPLGEEGHEVAKGCARVRMIMIFLFYLSVLCPVHPFPLRGTSPQGETRDMRRKTASHILHVPFRCSPLWWLAPPPFPVGSMSYDTESQSRNADFISIVRRAIRNPQRRRRCRPPERQRTQPFYTTRGGAAPLFLKIAAKPPPQPSARRAVKLKNPPAAGRSILRTLTPQARYTRRNVLLLPIYSGWCFLWQQRWPLHFLIIRIRWSIFPLPACGRSTLRTMMSRIRS